MRERLEEEKREIEKEREEERERFSLQIHQLQTEKARLAEEKSQIEREELEQATEVYIYLSLLISSPHCCLLLLSHLCSLFSLTLNVVNS